MSEAATISATNCPRCKSSKVTKNGFNRGKQRYKCKDCNRHFQQPGNTIQDLTKPKTQSHRSSTPERVVILLTSHRSGSTWLSDTIRCHPQVEYYPTPVVYEELGLSGRRYPGDLSNQADCNYEIEVQPGKFDKIPQFDLTPDIPATSLQLEFAPYGIEKCHPSFFDFDPDLFIQKVEHLERLKIEIKLICLVRDPQSLITSFMNYQQRKPSWYKQMIGAKLVEFIINTYQCIEQVAKKRSPLIFDYANLKNNMPQVLQKIYRQLWTEVDEAKLEYLSQISDLATKYTARNKRIAQTDSPFLGKIEGSIKGGDGKYRDFFDAQQELMAKCYSCYERICQLDCDDNLLP